MLLNSLNTLLIEPFKFAYEVVQQLVETWEFEFAYLPTEDLNKLNHLIEVLEDKQLNEALRTKNELCVQTSERTLIVNATKVINTVEKYHNSFFFKQNKDSDLFQTCNPKIQKAYNEMNNLTIFYYLTQMEMCNLFPKELTQFIFSLCSALNSPKPEIDHLYPAIEDSAEYNDLII